MKLIYTLILALSITPINASATHAETQANKMAKDTCIKNARNVKKLADLRINEPEAFYILVDKHVDRTEADLNKGYVVSPFYFLGRWIENIPNVDKHQAGEVSESYYKMCLEDNLV
jgi:hypothetical protein